MIRENSLFPILGAIETVLNNYTIAPDLIVEDGQYTYVMYCLPNTQTEDDPTWAIIRYETVNIDGKIKTIKTFAEGTFSFNKKASSYSSYNYKFKTQ